MAQILKTNLQVIMVAGATRKTKTFSNAIAQVDDAKAQQFGTIIASLAPSGSNLEQVKAVETKAY